MDFFLSIRALRTARVTRHPTDMNQNWINSALFPSTCSCSGDDTCQHRDQAIRWITGARFPVRYGTFQKSSHTGSGPTQLPPQWANFLKADRPVCVKLTTDHWPSTRAHIKIRVKLSLRSTLQVRAATCFDTHKVIFVHTEYKHRQTWQPHICTFSALTYKNV
jgi:hypothetical protein